MKTQLKKEGFKEAELLQSQCDSLRAKLKATSKFDTSSEEFRRDTELLKRLDRLFSLQCGLSGLELSKFGRLL
jgi:hypothetical protein